MLANDKDSVRETELSLSNKYLDFEYRSKGVAWARRDHHTVIYAPNDSTRLRGISYSNPTTTYDIKDLIRKARDSYKEESETELPFVINKVVPAHNKQLQTASFRWDIEPDGIFYTFPSNLIGINSGRFLRESVIASTDALRNNSVRDCNRITDDCIAKYINNETIEKDHASTFFMKQLFEKLSGAHDSMHR